MAKTNNKQQIAQLFEDFVTSGDDAWEVEASEYPERKWTTFVATCRKFAETNLHGISVSQVKDTMIIMSE